MTQMELDPQAVPAPESPGTTPIIEMTDISIAFGGVRALSDVSLRLFPGEVHALMGENGAGKSTMIKALTGVYTIDAGTITVAGERHEFSSPAESQEAGISTVYQEVNLAPNLTVAENMLLGREPRRFGGINFRAMNRRARATLERLGLDIDPTSVLGRAPDRGAAAGRDRPGRGRRRARPHPRRAHLEPRLRRGREALHGDAHPA